MKRLSLLVVTLLFAASMPALAASYVWTGTGGDNLWTNANNWSPARNTPDATDTLAFQSADSQGVAGIPTQTVSVLWVVNNTTINLQAGAAATLTINNYHFVEGGSRVIVSGANALTTMMAPGVTASIAGTVEYIGGTHKLNAADATGILFLSGSTMIQGLGCTGNVFTNAGTANAVYFQAGSQFIQYAGSNPFGLTAPNSKVVFQPGSWFRSRMSGTPSFSNRTYANFQLDFPTASISGTGGGIATLDTLLITDGRLNFQTRHINIKGAIIVLDTLYFNSATSCSLYLNGTSRQTMDWSASNSFMLGAQTHVLVDNAAGVLLNNNLVVNCKLHLLNGRVITGANQVSVASDSAVVRTNGYVLGTMWHTVNPGATVGKNYTVGNDSGYSPVVLTFNNVTSAGGAAVGITQAAHSGASVPENTLRNYWTVTPTGMSFIFDSCNAQFGYRSGDFNTGFNEGSDEGTMVVGKYDAGVWSFPAIVARDTIANTIDVSGLTTFSDLALGKDQAAFAAPDTIDPTASVVSPAFGATDVGLTPTVVIAFSEPMNTGSITGYSTPTDPWSIGFNAAGDTMTLTTATPLDYNSLYNIIGTAGTDLSGNPLAVLPCTLAQFTTIANQGPAITMTLQPGDTYDGSGPFMVRAVITDPAKQGVAGTAIYYSLDGGGWNSGAGVPMAADTFNFGFGGPIANGTLVSYYIMAADDAGDSIYSPATAPIGAHSFRILDPLPPTALNATGLDMAVDLSWAPPAQVLSYNTGVVNYYGGLPAGFISTTRYTPMHYPCRLEQVNSVWYDNTGMDSVIVHVYADDGTGMPDEATQLVAPFRIMPQDYPIATVVDLSGYNIVLASGEFHIGYELVTDGMPAHLSDGVTAGPVRSLYYWPGDTWYGDLEEDWIDEAVVSYSSYTKGMALKSSHLPRGQKPNYLTTSNNNLKAELIANKQAVVYPKLTGALAMAKGINFYMVERGDAPGGPYSSIGSTSSLTYLDSAVSNGTPYYYVVYAHYSMPDTYSVVSNEAAATPAALPILLVNDAANSTEDAEAIYTAALDAAGQSGQYSVYRVGYGEDGPSAAWYGGRSHIVWWTGDDYETTLGAADEASLASYLDGGGKLFLSADDYIYDVYSPSNQTYTFTAGQFPYDYLGVDSVTQDFVSTTDFSIAGMAGNLAEGMSFLVPDGNPQDNYPDDLIRRPAAGTYDIFDVTAKVGEKPGIGYYNGTFRTVFFAFPFENLVDGTSPNTQGELMARILSWLNTGVEGNPTADLSKPAVYSLNNCYPNPVRGQTTVKFALPKAGNVRIAVYNVAGQKVKTLVDGTMNSGFHTVNWNGKNEGGQAVAAGVYMYKMQAEGFSSTRKLVVIR